MDKLPWIGKKPDAGDACLCCDEFKEISKLPMENGYLSSFSIMYVVIFVGSSRETNAQMEQNG
nr:hypothetical protein [Anoxybacillus sp. LAT_38]